MRCEFRGDGLKRCPVSREYVTGLERKIEELEGLLQEVKNASERERQKLIGSIDFAGYCDVETTIDEKDRGMEYWKVDAEGSISRCANVFENGGLLTFCDRIEWLFWSKQHLCYRPPELSERRSVKTATVEQLPPTRSCHSRMSRKFLPLE